MAEKKAEPAVNPAVLDQLREAFRLQSVLKKADRSVRFWEIYSLVHSGEPVVGSAAGAGATFPGLQERLDALRKDPGPVIAGLERFLPDRPGEKKEFPAHLEWTLGMMAVSQKALDSARRWVAEPDKYAQEAEVRLRILQGIVLRYRLALQFPGATATSFTEEDAGPGRDVEAPPKVEKPPPPAPPAGLSARTDEAGVSLTWKASAGATRYKVMRSTHRRGPYKPVGLTAALKFIDAGVRRELAYFYAVKAQNEGGQSGPSARVEVKLAGRAPLRPLGLESAPGNGQIFLFWAASTDVTEYRIKRAEVSGGPYSEVGRSGEAMFSDEQVANGTTYFYVVCAARAGMESEPSPEACATPASTAGPVDGEEAAAASRAASRPPELPDGVEFYRILDLRRFDQLRFLLDDVADGLELWEVLAYLSDGGGTARDHLDRLVVMKDEGREEEYAAGASELLEGILVMRSRFTSQLLKLRAYLDVSSVPQEEQDLLDLAMALFVSDPQLRADTERWFEDPDACEAEAGSRFKETLALAGSYLEALSELES